MFELCWDEPCNHNGFDNRKSNLREATHTQNAQNRKVQKRSLSGYKGVWKQNIGGWAVRIVINKKRIYLGTYSTKEEAAMAYNEAAIEHFGEFAYLNEIKI